MEDTKLDKVLIEITRAKDLIEATLPKCRENSLAMTKLDEAEMWLKKGNK